MAVSHELAERLIGLRNALLDWEICVDERRRDADAAAEVLRITTDGRDAALRQLADLLVTVVRDD